MTSQFKSVSKALLLPFNPSAKTTQIEVSLPTTSQYASPLFSLPAELRSQIWHDILEGLILDLFVQNQKLSLRPPHKSGNLLSMLLACHQSYNELHPLIYASRPLKILHPSTLLHLSNTISPSSLNSITSLSLTWPLIGLPHLSYINLGNYQLHRNELDALRIWAVIADMHALKTLKVELNVPGIWRDSWKGWEDVLLNCLVEVGGWKGLGGKKSNIRLGGEESAGSSSRSGEDWKANCEYEYEEGGWGLWVPWPRIEKKDGGEGDEDRDGEAGKGWVERLGCEIVWG